MKKPDDTFEKMIHERMQKLPDVTREALVEFDWKNEVLSIGRKFDMNLDQLNSLETETTLVLVGLLAPRRYPNELKKRLGTNTQATQEIIKQINASVFKKIRNRVIELSKKQPKKDTQGEESTPPVPQKHLSLRKLSTKTTQSEHHSNHGMHEDGIPEMPQKPKSSDPYREPIEG